MQYVNNYAYVHNCVLKIDGNYYGFDYNGYMYQDSEFRDLYNGEHRAKADGTLYVSEWYQDSDGYWYYYDESRNSVQNEWVEQYYYIGEDGKMVRNQYVDRFFVSQYGNWNPRFEVPYWLMHGEWKKNGNVWIYQYNGIVQTMDFSQIRSICRLGYDTSNEKKHIAWQLKKVLQSCCVIYVLRRIMFPYVFMMSISIELPEIRVDRN